jgi:hypothetical protein
VAAKNLSIFISNPSVKVASKVREREHHEQQRSDDPEADLVAALDGRHGANLTRLAIGGRTVDALPGETKRNQRNANEKGPIGLKNLEVRKLGAADAQTHKHQRHKAARTSEQGRDTSEGNRGGLQRTPSQVACTALSLFP